MQLTGWGGGDTFICRVLCLIVHVPLAILDSRLLILPGIHFSFAVLLMFGEVVVPGGFPGLSPGEALGLFLALAWLLGCCCGRFCFGRAAHSAQRRGSNNGVGFQTPPRGATGRWPVEELPSGERVSVRWRGFIDQGWR